jgi:hypothetical protein
MIVFLILVILLLLTFCLWEQDNPVGYILIGIWVITCLFCSMDYRAYLIKYKNVDAKIEIIRKNSTKIAEQINAIDLKNVNSISLGDSPYKSTIETYTKMIESLTEKENDKVRYRESIEFAERGFFKYTNLLFVNKRKILTDKVVTK